MVTAIVMPPSTLNQFFSLPYWLDRIRVRALRHLEGEWSSLAPSLMKELMIFVETFTILN